MDENRVKELLLKNLLNNPLNQATFDTSRQIKEELLVDIFAGVPLKRSRWELIREMHDAHSQIGCLNPYSQNVVTISSPQALKSLTFLADTLKKASLYVLDNYESAGTENFRKRSSRSDLEKGMNSFFRDMAEITARITDKEGVVVTEEQIQQIQEIMQKLMIIVMGEPQFNRLAEEFSRVIPILHRYYEEYRREILKSKKA